MCRRRCHTGPVLIDGKHVKIGIIPLLQQPLNLLLLHIKLLHCSLKLRLGLQQGARVVVTACSSQFWTFTYAAIGAMVTMSWSMSKR